MKYKLVAIDVDGTLLSEGKVLSKENIDAILYANSKGVHVVIATGRLTTSASIFAHKIGYKPYIISSNGARVKNTKTNEVIFEDSMNLQDAKMVAKVYEEYGVYYHSYIGDTMYVRYMTDPVKFYTSQNENLPDELKVDIQLREDFNPVFDANSNCISKVMTICEDKSIIDAIKKDLEPNKNITTMSSWFNNLEAMNKTVSKGNALSHLASSLGIEQSEVIAIGDNENDLAMIEYAGMGIAMGNAIERVKNVSNDITDDCNNFGVAKAIYKYI